MSQSVVSVSACLSVSLSICLLVNLLAFRGLSLDCSRLPKTKLRAHILLWTCPAVSFEIIRHVEVYQLRTRLTVAFGELIAFGGLGLIQSLDHFVSNWVPLKAVTISGV